MGTIASLGRIAHRLGRDRRGIAAIEFALVVPLLLLLYMGGTDATRAVTLHRKLQDAAGTMADMATQRDGVTKTELTGLVTVARDILRPYPTNRLRATIVGVEIDASGKAKVAWSIAHNVSNAPQKGAAYTLPGEFQGVKDTFVVVSRSEYTYLPVGGYGYSRAFDLSGDAVFRARGKGGVRCGDC